MSEWCFYDFYDPRYNELYIGFILHIQTARSDYLFKVTAEYKVLTILTLFDTGRDAHSFFHSVRSLAQTSVLSNHQASHAGICPKQILPLACS